MKTQNGRRGYCTKYIQLIQSVWAESRACTVYCTPHILEYCVLGRLSAHSDWDRWDRWSFFAILKWFSPKRKLTNLLRLYAEDPQQEEWLQHRTGSYCTHSGACWCCHRRQNVELWVMPRWPPSWSVHAYIAYAKRNRL